MRLDAKLEATLDHRQPHHEAGRELSEAFVEAGLEQVEPVAVKDGQVEGGELAIELDA